MKSNDIKGQALPLVIVILVVFALLVAALWGFAVSEARGAAWQANTTQAHFLARSGVHAGVKILKQQLDLGTYTDMTSVITASNNYIMGLSGNDFNITNVGSYTIVYEPIDSQTIKIRSIGTAAGSDKTVTLTTRLSFPASSVLNPDDWVVGINLTHSVNTSANYLGQGVTLEGKPIRSPQGGNVPSIFQASSILFTDYGGLSLKQINQSVSITFDSEVLYFQTATELNANGITGTKNDVLFSLSDAVLNNRPSGQLNYGTVVGFENVDRYNAFINGISGGVDYSGYYTDDPVANPNTYPFLTNERYGVVYFGGNVAGSNPSIPAGYYFFSSGIGGANPVSLKTNDLITNKKLIPIETDDKLIDAIESMFKYTLGSTEPRMWDDN